MQAFVAVADLQGFAPAARKLGLSPSGGDAADCGAGRSSRRAAVAADHAIGDADRCRRALSGAGQAHPRRYRGSRRRGRGRAHAAERPAGGLGAPRIRTSACQPADVGLSEAISRGLRRIAAVGSHDQPGGRRRRPRRQDRPSRRFQPGRAPCRRDAADRGRLAGYLKQRGEPKTPAAIAVARHHTVRRHDRAPDWRFVEDGREVRVACTPRFVTNSADAAIQYAEQGGGLTRVLAYQAAEAIKAGRLRIVLAKFERRRCRSISSIRPRGCCRPRCGPSSIWSTEISDWHFGGEVNSSSSSFFGTTRNVALARAMTTPSAFIKHCAKQIVLPVLITSVSTASHCPTCAAADEIDRHADRHQRRCVRP